MPAAAQLAPAAGGADIRLDIDRVIRDLKSRYGTNAVPPTTVVKPAPKPQAKKPAAKKPAAKKPPKKPPAKKPAPKPKYTPPSSDDWYYDDYYDY